MGKLKKIDDVMSRGVWYVITHPVKILGTIFLGIADLFAVLMSALIVIMPILIEILIPIAGLLTFAYIVYTLIF